jgi:L-cysteine S-thiosulfotransferase
MMRNRGRTLVRLGAVALAAVASYAVGQGSTVDEIAKYRAALQDGNPAELWEARGEQLWKHKRGPKNASLERCDLGKGPGVVKGAYAELPRYFADADRVMDL